MSGKHAHPRGRSTDAIRHYEDLLAEFYAWTCGPFEEVVERQKRLLAELAPDAISKGGLAVDLGSGPGYQAIALAQLGFDPVLAIDTSELLLGELSERISGLPIKPVNADMRDLPQLVADKSARIITCMGDTLTHLATFEEVRRLFADCARALTPAGQLVLAFRDLSNALTGLDRFLPVKADDQRIMTCALEFDPEGVTVNDLIYVRDEDGWHLRKSSYRKLRLSPARVAEELSSAGFTIGRSGPSGSFHAIVATI